MRNLIANWPAPSNIGAVTTTRLGGTSCDEFASNNLGLHVDDKREHVLTNRQNVITNLKLPGEPFWLKQTHTNICSVVNSIDANRDADAATTSIKKIPLAILTADCVPIVICNQKGSEIAAIHAGWRGLANGIIENTLQKLQQRPHDYLAWVGPAICHKCYETGHEVYQKFTAKYANLEMAFSQQQVDKCHADLPLISKIILQNHGLNSVHLSNVCNFEENSHYYSYRHQAKTGRMATIIWFKDK